jgi:hypothetical protein
MIRSFTIIVLLLGLLCSCKTNNFKQNLLQRKLVKHTWVMTSYVDHSINEQMDVSETTFKFCNDGSLLKTLKDGTEYELSWSFFDEAAYLVIGDNTFKINTLTNRLLGVSYGEVDIFFVPVD